MTDTTFLKQFSQQYCWASAPAKRRFAFRKQINRGMIEEHRLALTMRGVIDRALDDVEGLQSSDYSTYQIFDKGDLVFKLIDLENIKTSRVGLVPCRGIMSPAYIRLSPNPKKAESRFYAWFFLAAYHNNIFNGMGGGVRQNLTQTDLLEFPIPLPDLPTQRAIADFLDRETARIDTLIEKKQRLVELLGEKVKATITQAVRGAGDASRKRLRHVVSLNPSTKEIRIPKSQMVTFCAMEAIQDGIGGLDPSISRQLSDVISGSYNYFTEGDVLLAKVTPCFENGKKALAANLQNGIGFATSEVFVIRPDREKLSAEYLIYLLSSEEFQYAGRASMTGAGGLKRISEKSIMDFPLLVENLNEQNLIVAEIDKFVSISTKISSAANH